MSPRRRHPNQDCRNAPTLDTLTIVLMLLAGLLHASWHSFVKYGGDQNLVLAGMGLVAAALAACAAPFLAFPPAEVWLVIAGSVLLHVGYKLALARAYALGDLGQAYPLARGFVLLFATFIAFVLFAQSPTVGQAAGIGFASLGLIWLAGHSIRGGIGRSIFAAALAAGLTVAGYSVVDAYGTRLNGDWASFTAWLMIADSLTFLALVHAIKGQRIWRDLWQQRGRMVASGVLGAASFSVFVWAPSRSPVGAVTALRESSGLFATVIGMAAYGEECSAQRLTAASVIVAGLAIIATLK